MCNCLKVIDEQLKDQYQDPGAHIDKAFSLHLSKATGKRVAVDYPHLRAMVHLKKAGGVLRTRESEIIVSPSYCPFCGKPYFPEEVEGRSIPDPT